MVKTLCFPVLFLPVLVGILIIWSVVERRSHPFDLSLHDPEFFNASDPIDISQHYNQDLFKDARIIFDQKLLNNPEDVVVDQQGRIITGLHDGRIVRIALNNSFEQLGTKSGGLILGLILSKNQQILYFLTENQGFCKLNLQTYQRTILLKDFEGKYLTSLNNLAIDYENNKIYITQASKMIPMKFSNKEIMLKKALGRVLVYDIQSKKTQVLLDNLYFPNGIAYDQANKLIYVNELNRYRILRIYTQGPSKGQIAVVVSNLVGFPDNLKLAQNGDLLVGFPTIRDSFLTFLDKKPILRKLLIWLPEVLMYSFAKKIAAGARINPRNGKITYYVGDAETTSFVTTIYEKGNKLYFSSLLNPRIVVIDSQQLKRRNSEEKDEL